MPEPAGPALGPQPFARSRPPAAASLTPVAIVNRKVLGRIRNAIAGKTRNCGDGASAGGCPGARWRVRRVMRVVPGCWALSAATIRGIASAAGRSFPWPRASGVPRHDACPRSRSAQRDQDVNVHRGKRAHDGSIPGATSWQPHTPRVAGPVSASLSCPVSAYDTTAA